jgi:hypothetical protein
LKERIGKENPLIPRERVRDLPDMFEGAAQRLIVSRNEVRLFIEKSRTEDPRGTFT